MPVTNRDFFKDNYHEIEEILQKNNVRQCFLGHFSDIGLQMFLDVDGSKDFYKLKNDLLKLSVSKGTAFTLKFCGTSCLGQPMFKPEEVIDFRDLEIPRVCNKSS